jgi:hypothetical protein
MLESFPQHELPPERRIMSGPRVNDLDMQEEYYKKAVQFLEQNHISFEARQTVEAVQATDTQNGSEAEFAVQIMNPENPEGPASDEYVVKIWQILRAQGISVDHVRSVTDLGKDRERAS